MPSLSAVRGMQPGKYRPSSRRAQRQCAPEPGSSGQRPALEMNAPKRPASDDETDRDNINILMQTLGIPSLLRQLKDKRRRRATSRVPEPNELKTMPGVNRNLYPQFISETRFHIYYRVTKEQFHEVHELVKNDINMKSTTVRPTISTKERLLMSLRFLGTGKSLNSLGSGYGLGFNTVREILLDVCNVICEKMGPIYMPRPTPAVWKASEDSHRTISSFPNCCGVIYGKLVNLSRPIDDADFVWDYNEDNAVVLLAVTNARGKFIFVDIGQYNGDEKGGMFEKSVLRKLIENGQLQLPPPKPLCPNTEPLSHVFVADETFPLKPYLMRPYSVDEVHDNEYKKIYNFRLYRARYSAEIAFASLRGRWRAFNIPLPVQPDMVAKIFLATCCLHNYLDSDNMPPDYRPEKDDLIESATFSSLKSVHERFTDYALSVRDKYNRYFCEEGALPWQVDQVKIAKESMR